MALYLYVRDLTPLKSLINEVSDNLRMDSEKLEFVSSSTIYDENNGAVLVATMQRMTHHLKRISIKYHWFSQNYQKLFWFKILIMIIIRRICSPKVYKVSFFQNWEITMQLVSPHTRFSVERNGLNGDVMVQKGISWTIGE